MPLDEVKFRRRHRQNLDLVKKQMQSEAVQAIIETVKKSTPVFPEQFMEIEKEVDEQLELATETERLLHRLHRFREQIDTVSEGLDALQEKFESIFHLLYLMYKRTRWYHRPHLRCCSSSYRFLDESVHHADRRHIDFRWLPSRFAWVRLGLVRSA
jgi:hypothetical protein